MCEHKNISIPMDNRNGIHVLVTLEWCKDCGAYRFTINDWWEDTVDYSNWNIPNNSKINTNV